MYTLGIETSCDETAASIVKDGCEILSDVKATSFDVHVKYGGIIPDKAAREQLQSILPIIHEATSVLPGGLSDIDQIAVTYGPGLIGSLLIGVETAKTLSLTLGRPIVPVNHLIGHIYANWLTSSQNQKYELPSHPPEFPCLVLIVSGGHSELVLMKSHQEISLVGSTRDDAAGECFDKCGRILGLPYPYGIHIGPTAVNHKADNPFKVRLPRPMIHQNNFEFSFSGLKTAVSTYLKETDDQVLSPQQQSLRQIAVAHELQEAITDSLVKKFFLAAQTFVPNSLVVCGGVAANLRLREKINRHLKENSINIPFYIPDVSLCTDNAVAIASAGYFQNNPVSWEKITASPGLDIKSNDH